MGFPRQQYWSGLLFPSPEDLPDPGIKPMSPALKADSLPLSHQGNSVIIIIIIIHLFNNSGFPGGSEGKGFAYNAWDLGLIPGSGRSPGEGHGNPTPVFLPRESHGRKSLVGYMHSPWGRRESDTTEQLHFLSFYSITHLDISEICYEFFLNDKHCSKCWRCRNWWDMIPSCSSLWCYNYMYTYYTNIDFSAMYSLPHPLYFR